MKQNIEYSANHYRRLSGIKNLPDNFAAYCSEHYCNVQINVCLTDVECGYGERISGNIKIMLPYKECTRCGYHSLWNPDDTESKCLRHNYKRGYDTVFCYDIENRNHISLEQAFDVFLKEQKEGNSPIKKIVI